MKEMPIISPFSIRKTQRKVHEILLTQAMFDEPDYEYLYTLLQLSITNVADCMLSKEAFEKAQEKLEHELLNTQ